MRSESLLECKNCDPSCGSQLKKIRNGKYYHVSRELELQGFRDSYTGIRKMGSVCPECGCRKPKPTRGHL